MLLKSIPSIGDQLYVLPGNGVAFPISMGTPEHTDLSSPASEIGKSITTTVKDPEADEQPFSVIIKE